MKIIAQITTGLLLIPIFLIGQTVDGEPIHNVLPRDAIRALLTPKFVTGSKADRIMSADEQVLGVVGPGGTPVAYSTWHLDHHEIVNDLVDGLPIAATW